MLVFFQEPVEVFLDERYVLRFDLLFDVETGNALYYDLCYYPYGADAPYRRLEQII